MHHRRNALHSLWMELNTVVSGYLEAPAKSHPFMARFLKEIDADEDGFVGFVRQVQTQFETSLLQSLRNPYAANEIPPFTHRIWLTKPSAIALPPDAYLDNIIRMNLVLADGATHFFWTNSSQVMAHVHAKAAMAGCRNLCVMNLDMLASDPLFPNVERLVVDSKFVVAADILKFIVLNRFGGIYSDLGIVYDSDIFDLVRVGDYGLVVSDNIFFQTSFVACAPGADIARLMLALAASPGAFDRSFALLGPTPGALDEVHAFAGFGFTACLMLFLPKGARAVLVPASSAHMQWHSQASWYGDQPKFGNALVATTAASIYTASAFDAADALFQKHVTMFGSDAALRARLRALVVAHGYFATSATRFCEVFFFNGSDKAMAWHNYGYVYNYLLGRMRGGVTRILEVGIGTNNLDVASTMGVTGVPGASLRAWKECFVGATVVGADVDERILFQEPGIETYWVDQTDPGAVAGLFEKAGPAVFDIIIDDGLHTFSANRTLFEVAYTKVRDGGMYVIEDVPNHDVPAWEEYLGGARFCASIVALPSEKNTSDNRLIFVPGGQ